MLPQVPIADDARWGDAEDRDSGRSEASPAEGGDEQLVPHGTLGTSAQSAIVLAEDKKYYPESSEVYPGAETLVQDEDAQPITQPIIAPVKSRLFSTLEAEAPVTTYSTSFLTALMASPHLIRNVTIAGHLHHGKSTFCDILVESTHEKPWDPAANVRYTDARVDEQERGLSIKASPVSLVLPDTSGKSYLLNVIDAPGHVNFSDEATAAFRATDGVVLVVDAIEGVMMNTERLARHALTVGLPLTLVINKVDRLILELKLPPADAYFKLAHTIAEVNALIAAHPAGAGHAELSPAAGNVAFAGALHGWSFTLESFAALYAARWSAEIGSAVDHRALASRLWGDLYYDTESRRFHRSARQGGSSRSFVHFILEPLYKLYSEVLGQEGPALANTLRELNVGLSAAEFRLDPQPLLKLVARRFLGAPMGIVDMIVRHVPSPVMAAARRVERTYTGAATSAEAVAMTDCNADGPLMANVVKLLPTPDGSSFLALARIISGTVVVGQRVKVLGEAYAVGDDEEDVAERTITAVSVGQARWRVDITRAPAGNLVLLEGIDDVITKTATVTGAGDDTADVRVFRPLIFDTRAVVHLAVEPLNPAELPKVLAGLRKITKSYPLASTRVEESGEHVIMGTGELAMDCIMHDLR